MSSSISASPEGVRGTAVVIATTIPPDAPNTRLVLMCVTGPAFPCCWLLIVLGYETGTGRYWTPH
jgi:hypothetical protein